MAGRRRARSRARGPDLRVAAQTSSPGASAPDHYSRAFEAFVPDGTDIVGLLGYALYKAHIREALTKGRPVNHGADRTPTDSEVRAFRGEAERRLSAFAESVIEQATPGIERTALVAAMDESKASIVAEIGRRTSYRTAITANVIGWLVSIAITVLVVISGVPSWLSRLAMAVGGSP